ncbi:MAG TPA: efflux transporter outer membrane subunit [Steroidobacteraceae bacterium]|nr:efflux transporter outer membrane subunit [Steroidobacteraceae bacterium]
MSRAGPVPRSAPCTLRGGCRAALAACVAALGACSFAPPYRVPDTGKPPAQYKELGDWKIAQPRDAQPRGRWWTVYNDPELDALEDKVPSNLSLQAAFARLQQARAQYRIARADLFPSVTADPHATRERFSTNAPQELPGYPKLFDDFLLGADFTYEVDLWGRVRNEVTSARASRQASAADYASVELSLRAQLAEDYFNLRSDDAQSQLLDKTVGDYEKSLQLETDLFDGGAAALADVAQAQAQLDNARTQAADIKLQRAQAEHALAVLLGENPSLFSLPVNALPLDVVPPPIDPGFPSTLLERRPDVAEAERRVAAANAQIGVARAAYFPQLTLAADGGVESTRTANLFSAPSRYWSVGPQLSLPIFEGGRLVGETARVKALYEEQVADYRNTVLGAYQDVEDNLIALRQLQQESETDAAAVLATGVALQQAIDRYRAGIVTYLEVSTAETAALQAQVQATTIQARRMSASVLLIKALGGGWRQSSLRSE